MRSVRETEADINAISDQFVNVMAKVLFEGENDDAPAIVLTGFLLAFKGFMVGLPEDPPPEIRNLVAAVDACLISLGVHGYAVIRSPTRFSAEVV